MKYTEFVKANYAKVAHLPVKERMVQLGQMWRKSGHADKKVHLKGKKLVVGEEGGDVAGGIFIKRKLGGKKGMRKAKGKGVTGGAISGKGIISDALGVKGLGMKKKVGKAGKVSKAMKSVGGAIPWNWEFIDPSRGISEQLEDYAKKGLVNQTNPLGKATMAQVKKAGGDEQTLEYNHRFWDAKDESNRLLNAVSVDNQRRADEPSGLEKFATGALGALAEGATKALTEGAGLKKRGRKAKGKGVVGGATVGGALSQKEKMKMKNQMHKLEAVSHNKKLTKLQDKKLKHLHNLHGGNLLNE